MSTDLTPRERPLEAGEAAPDFTLKTQDQKDWTLSAELDKGDVVLCFYPMDFSPVCSTEMKCVTDDFEKWLASGAQVVGISCDSFFVHAAWADQLGLKQTLLADMHREVCRAYGFYWPDLNISKRGTVVVTKGASGPEVKWVQHRDIPEAMDSDQILQAIS